LTYIGYTRKGQNIGLVGLGSGIGERFGGVGNEAKVGGFKALAKLFIYIYIYTEPLGTGRGLVPPCLNPG